MKVEAIIAVISTKVKSVVQAKAEQETYSITLMAGFSC